MEKKIEDYLNLYLGCKVSIALGEFDFIGIEKDCAVVWNKIYGRKIYLIQLIKPILRPLSDMTEEEAEDFALSCLNSRHAPEHFDPVEKDELQIEFVKNDGGNFLDDDVEIYIGLSCRCLDGYISIMKDGRIGMSEEDDIPTKEMEPIDDVYGKVHWLLSKHFDLFGLIESGLAIDATHNTANELK